MNVLVTGGNGFIGSHLVELLLSRHYSVRCLVRKTSDLTWVKGLDVEFVQGDLFDHDALRKAVTGIDYVYHSAGITKAKKKEDYDRGNTTGTKNIMVSATDAVMPSGVIAASRAAAPPDIRSVG